MVESEATVEEDDFKASLQATIQASRALTLHVLETPGMGPSTSSGMQEQRKKWKNRPDSEEF